MPNIELGAADWVVGGKENCEGAAVLVGSLKKAELDACVEGKFENREDVVVCGLERLSKSEVAGCALDVEAKIEVFGA